MPGDYHYAVYETGREKSFTEYYDLRRDPWRLLNRADPEDPWQRSLASLLEADRRCSGPPCP